MTRQLRTLLKQNRDLEEKIFYQSREDDWRKQLITSQELSSALTYLSTKIADNRSDELSVLNMLNNIDKIKGRPLPTYEKNALQVVEILFNYLREYSKFDSEYYHVLNSLQIAFIRLSLNDLSFLDNSKHIAVIFLEKLIKLGHHFDKNAGKLAQLFIHAIELLIDRLANRSSVTVETFTKANEKLDEYFDSFNEKASQNIAKIFSLVEVESRAAEADLHTDRIIKSKTEGEEIPIFLLDFFEHQLKPILHKTISVHGGQSKQCQQLLTDMDTLNWSITYPLSDESYQHRFEADVSAAMKRIHQQFVANNALNSYVTDFFAEAEDIQNKKLQGQRVSYDVMISADIFADESYEEDDKAWLEEPNANDYYDISLLKEGNWYCLNIDDKEQQTRLLMINELTKQLIFINLSGEMVRRVEFSDSAFLRKKLVPIMIEDKIAYRHATKALVRELSARLEILKKEYEIFIKQQVKNEAQQQKEEAKARAAVKLKIEEDKQQQALKRQELLRKEALLQEQEILKEEENAKQRFYIKGIYRKLKPGTVIAFKTVDHGWKEASLTLISKTTQRHIFSDSRGNKVIDPTKDELLTYIKDQRIKIINQPASQTNAVQSLVMQRREKLQNN